MFEVTVRSHFSAAHHLKGYAGQCAQQHGHNWSVEVTLRGTRLNATGILVDFRQIKDALKEALGGLDHSDLNKHKAFRRVNPTSENLARFIFAALARRLDGPRCKVYRVSVSETPDNTASFMRGTGGRS